MTQAEKHEHFDLLKRSIHWCFLVWCSFAKNFDGGCLNNSRTELHPIEWSVTVYRVKSHHTPLPCPWSRYSVLLSHRLVILDFECIINVVFLWICGYRLVLGANERYVGQFNVGVKREKTRVFFFQGF